MAPGISNKVGQLTAAPMAPHPGRSRNAIESPVRGLDGSPGKSSHRTPEVFATAKEAKDWGGYSEKDTMLKDLKKFEKNCGLNSRLPNDPRVLRAANTSIVFGAHAGETSMSAVFAMLPITQPASKSESVKNRRSADQDVLRTNELLEHVLSFLAARKLYHVQRVSKLWRSVINSSPGIRKKLFLRLANKKRQPWIQLTDSRNLPYRPALVGELHQIQAKPDPYRRLTTPVTLNPVLERYNGPLKRSGDYANYHGHANVLHYQDACFRDNYVTDPPCNKVCIRNFTIAFGKVGPAYRLQMGFSTDDHLPFPWRFLPVLSVSGIIVEAVAGLTMRDIFTAALHGCSREGQCRFSGGGLYSFPNMPMSRLIGFMMQSLRWASVPERPYVELRLNLLTSGSSGVVLA